MKPRMELVVAAASRNWVLFLEPPRAPEVTEIVLGYTPTDCCVSGMFDPEGRLVSLAFREPHATHE